MKWLLSVAALGATMLVPLSAALAQMRGGVSVRGPVGRGPAGPVMRGPVVAPVRSGPAVAPMRSGPMVRPAVLAARPVGARRFASSGRVIFTSRPFFPGRFHRFHNRFFFTNCFGGFPCNNGLFFGSNFGFGAPFWGYPYSYPLFSSDYAPPEQPPVVSSDNGATVDLVREVQQLSDQIEELRYEERRQAVSERQSAPATSGSATFVMRDGRHISAQNYAIAGETVWIFDEKKARKIPIAEVDRTATEQINAASGNEIRFP